MSRTYLTLMITVALGILASVLFPYYSVTPGVLIEGHTALKNDCFSCHTLGKGSQTNKCIRCHSVDNIGRVTVAGTPLQTERTKSILIHSSVRSMECYYCHTEHNGRSKESATAAFTHSILDQQKQHQCEACHITPTTYVHTFATIQCSECHNTAGWKTGQFDHTLLGAKVQQCTDCHVRNIPIDELHKSVVSKQQCGICHSTAAWKPSTYDHTKLFRFDNNHPANCSDCHSPTGGFKTYTCYTCHEHNEGKIASKHQEEGIRNFSNCVKCHRSGSEHEIIGREGGGRENRDGKRSEKNESKEEDDD
ncbi:MAG: hypothetical protein ACOYNS_15920 [Bacteroidota bacterium]